MKILVYAIDEFHIADTNYSYNANTTGNLIPSYNSIKAMNQARYKGFIRPLHSKLQAITRTLDGVLIFASLYFSIILYRLPLDREYLLPCLIATALFSFFAENNELYQGWRGAPMFDEAVRILFCWLGSFTILISDVFLYNSTFNYSFLKIRVKKEWVEFRESTVKLANKSDKPIAQPTG
jgi:hypothetical protein